MKIASPDAAGLLIASFYPTVPTTTSNGNNYSQLVDNHLNWSEWNVRGDYDIHQSNRATLRWTNDSWTNPAQNDGSPFWGESDFPTIDSSWSQPSRSIMAKLSSTITNSPHFQLNGRQAVEKHLNIHPSSAHIVWGFHDAIVSREQWEAVQVKYPVNHTERKGKKAYACSTLVKCGVCGKTMTAKTDQHGKVRYRCQSFSDATSPLCGGWTIREDELLDELLPRLTATLDAKTIEGLSVNPPTIAQPHEVEGLKAEVEKMKKDMGDRLARLHLIDLDFLPSYQTGIKEARQRLDAMMKQIAEMETPDLGEWKERLAKFWDETKTILVKTGEQMKVRNEWLGEAVIEPEAPIEPSTLRNALKGLKTTITLFFSRSQDGKRWNRTRTIVEGELGCPFDASSTDPGHG